MSEKVAFITGASRGIGAESAVALARERVRRAEIALGLIERYAPEAAMTVGPADDLGIPAAGWGRDQEGWQRRDSEE